jgi:hypothetical protein
MVSHGTRLYIPLAWYALQSLNLPPSFWLPAAAFKLGGLAADYPILRYFFLSIDWSHRAYADLNNKINLLMHIFFCLTTPTWRSGL